MRCLINGREVDSKALARVEMNFGQPFHNSEPPLSYEIVIPKAEFTAAMRDEYHRAVQEDIADAPYHQSGDWPLLDRLQELGYPPLEELIVRHPQLLADLVRDWLNLETLDLLFPGPWEGLPEYLINSVDGVSIDHQRIRIQGQAYRHPMLVQQA